MSKKQGFKGRIPMPINEKPIYQIKISNYLVNVYKLEKSYAVQEIKKSKSLYQYEISNEEFKLLEEVINEHINNK